jgi:all-trans-8'-apo-beta-carotenal 15,15'-oxygenase
VRLAFDQGRVRYTNRFVHTQGFLAEEAAGRLLYRGWGTNLPGGLPANLLRLTIKNIANTNVVYFGGRLLALWEGGLPYGMDPLTLHTLGPEDFGGRLRNRFSWLERRLAAVLPFSAHPCLDEDTGELYNFGLLWGLKPRLMLYSLGANGTLAEPRVHLLDRPSFVHSFQLTRRYLVFLLTHVDFDLPRSFLGLSTWAASLRIATHRPMDVLLIPRDGGPARTVAGPPGFVFHIAHGFDREDGALVLDLVQFRDYPPLDRLDVVLAPDNPYATPKLVRLTVDPLAGTCEARPLSPCPAELPRVFPGGFGRPRRYIYSIGSPEGRRAYYLSCIQRVDTQTGETIQRDFGPDLPGEPVPVPDGSGESGWLLTLVYRAEARRTDLVVLRSEDLGIEAVLPFPHAVPPGFHGSWVDAGAA